MSNSTTLIALSQFAVNTRNELNIIGANVKGLKQPGRDLMPLKPDMLNLPPEPTAMVMDAVELLFSASMRYVAAQINEGNAVGAVDKVAARIERGQAEATCIALLAGRCVLPLYLACERAPIAMYAILHLVPELDLENRLKEAMEKHRRIK